MSGQGKSSGGGGRKGRSKRKNFRLAISGNDKGMHCEVFVFTPPGSEMEESSDRNTSSGLSSAGTNKLTSDSGYGSNKSHSNKSNSQSQRSSGSSKSHQSSLSSGSSGFPSLPGSNVPTIAEHGPGLSGPHPTPGPAPKPKPDVKEHSKRKKKSKTKQNAGGSGSTPEPAVATRTSSQGEQQTGGSPLPPDANTASAATTATPQNVAEIQVQSSPDARPGPMDSKTLQMAALNHALSCMKKFQDNVLDVSDDCDDDHVDASVLWKEQFDALKDDLNFTSEEHCFGAIVSMDDGLVVHITEEITQILGYPKDMWVGRSFMDLVHSKDKMSFASQFTFTTGLMFPQGDYNSPTRPGGVANGTDSCFCRLRQYRGLKTSGFGVADKPVIFFPFRLTLKFKEVDGFAKLKTKKTGPVENEGESSSEPSKPVYLFIGASRVTSAYKYPEEVPANPQKFITRHSANCQFGHMDPKAVSYLGHLPQDLIGHSIFDYYHPDDMDLLKGIYEAVMVERGEPFKSKPYRFRVYNGTFAMLETDWSCFINPWSWKLEFVIGQHKVLKGPLIPNVFTPPKTPEVEDTVSDPKQLKDQIKQLLGETVTHRDPLKQRSMRRKKDLVNLLETLLDQIGNNESSDMSESVASGAFSVLDRDSVMLGEISPHHDCHSFSNQSSETPPSYNQLNYCENIARFFHSQPKTTRGSDESGGTPPKNDIDTDDEPKGSPHDSSGSGGNRQSGDNSNEEGVQSGTNSGSGENTSGNGNAPSGGKEGCTLTEDVLYKHNEYMEKCMVQKHRESRGKNSLASASNKNCRARHADHGKGERQNHLKRSGNAAGCGSSGSSRKAHKQPHLDQPSTSSNTYGERSSVPSMQPPLQRSSTINLWPPYSVGLAQASVTSTFATSGGVPLGGLQLPNVQYVTTGQPITIPRPQIVGNSASNSTYLCFPNTLTHYAPQQVSFPMGVPGNMFNTVMTGVGGVTSVPGTPGQFNANKEVYSVPGGSTQAQMHPQFLTMATAGTSVLHTGQLMQPGAPPRQMLPNTPGSVQPVGLNYAMNPGMRMQPVVPGSFLQLNSNRMMSTAGTFTVNSNQAKTRPPVSMVQTSTSSSSSMFSLSSTQPSVSEASGSRTSGPSSSSNERQDRKRIARNLHHRQIMEENRDLARERSRERSRGPPPKAPADFSSSDAFGDSSSGSVFSFLKHGKSSDGSSNSPVESPEGKDDANSGGDNMGCQWGEGEDSESWEDNGGRLMADDENGNGRFRQTRRVPRKPHWLQDVAMTADLSLRYQVATGEMSDVLQKDLEKMKLFAQPTLVNDQLQKLCEEIEEDENEPDLNLEEGSSRYNSSYGCGSSDSNDEEDETSKESTQQDTNKSTVRDSSEAVKEVGKKNKKSVTPWIYDKIVQVYEENAPFPPGSALKELPQVGQNPSCPEVFHSSAAQSSG